MRFEADIYDLRQIFDDMAYDVMKAIMSSQEIPIQLREAIASDALEQIRIRSPLTLRENRFLQFIEKGKHDYDPAQEDFVPRKRSSLKSED